MDQFVPRRYELLDAVSLQGGDDLLVGNAYPRYRVENLCVSGAMPVTLSPSTSPCSARPTDFSGMVLTVLATTSSLSLAEFLVIAARVGRPRCSSIKS